MKTAACPGLPGGDFPQALANGAISRERQG